MTAFRAGLTHQLWSLRSDLDDLQTFVLIPLFTLIFGGIAVSTGHRDLLAGTVLGAALMGMWTLCLQVGGSAIEQERWSGSFEALESTPAPLRGVILGRISAVILVAVLALPEAWLVALIVFGQPIGIAHPGLFVLTMLLTLAGLHATAMLFAGLFVLAREALIYQNALAYPMYLLGGLVFPVSVLPDWVQPITRLLFLSWGSDLLRDELSSAAVSDVGVRLLGLAGTAALVVVGGQLLFGVVLRRARADGTLNLV